MLSLGFRDMSLDFSCNSTMPTEMFLVLFAQEEKFGDSGHRIIIEGRMFLCGVLADPLAGGPGIYQSFTLSMRPGC